MTTAKNHLEKRRLAALNRLGILDTPPEERFDRMIRIARAHYRVKSASFSIIDEERQWFKSREGLDQSETPRSVAFCDYAIRQDKAMIVEDALLDPRFRDNPLVTGKPYIRFYAGIPVREPSGFKIGSLCIIDDKPHQLHEVDLDVLRCLASIIEDELERSFLSVSSDYIEVSHINRAIQRAQNVFLTNENERAAFEVLLSDLLALTGSQFGFIGEVHHRDDDTPYLKVRAITNIAWNPETQALYQEVERRGMVFDRLDNLLGSAMVSGDVVVSNAVGEDPRRGGLPKGHPPIQSYIGMPVYTGDEMIGLVGLANRYDGYQAGLAEELSPLLQTVGTLIERRRLYNEKLEHQKHLERAANFDALTGLPNRRHMTELFEQELVEAHQRGGTVSVCFIDLDGFKAINDTHGHAVGDSVLRSVASRLTSIVREHDVVGRLGGDEFVAILRDVKDERVYARILESLRKPISYRHFVLQFSGSMGVTVYPEDDAGADLLIRHADQAMYAAKEAGKNAYVMFDMGVHQNRKERVRVIEQVGRALREQQFVLHYQPRMNLASRRVEGFEALIRWQHPEDGLLGPHHFLDHLEYTEFARAVGLWVIAEGVQRLQAFEAAGLPYTVSVNLSPSHFLSAGFVSDLKGALAPLSFELRSRLILEVLETTALDDLENAIHTVLACQKLGVEVALDDFGVGYSSLDYFRRIPVQEIKIDRSFVSDMLEDHDGEMVVNAIVGLSRSFNRRVVAEGIESGPVADRLLSLGCSIGQGFHYARPMPLEDALAWAEATNQGEQPGGGDISPDSP